MPCKTSPASGPTKCIPTTLCLSFLKQINLAKQQGDKDVSSSSSSASSSSALDLLFGVQVEVTSNRNRNDGREEQPSNATVQIEKHRKLTCFLGTPQKPVSTLEESLKFSLGDEVVQVGNSGKAASTAAAAATEEAAAPPPAEETLTRSNRIKSLALYLILHFMRFEWKVGGTESEKAKICRSVKFGQTLDMFPFCTKVIQCTYEVLL